jgi:hypothetical protein
LLRSRLAETSHPPLTGRYKTNEPNFILAAFAPDTSALQIEINGIKVWLLAYQLNESKYHQFIDTFMLNFIRSIEPSK